MTNPTTETDELKAHAAARGLIQAILAWECLKDPTLREAAKAMGLLQPARPACEGEDADFIDAELERPYEDDGGHDRGEPVHPHSIHHITLIGEGEYNDFKMCLEQALECLARGEHEDGWVIFETFKLVELRELAEAVVLGCDDHLSGWDNPPKEPPVDTTPLFEVRAATRRGA